MTHDHHVAGRWIGYAEAVQGRGAVQHQPHSKLLGENQKACQ